MARALLIANPRAARTRAATVQRVERVIRAAGWSVEVLVTGGPGDARVLAESGVQDGVDVVAVLGGDGTTMQAAGALVGTGIAMGLIPGGTGNLLAANLRLPSNPIRATRAMIAGRPKPLDLGEIVRPDRSDYFAVAAGAGVEARVMTETASAQKRRWGIMAYVATAIRIFPEIRSVPFRVTVDGSEREIDAAMLLVANCGLMIPPFLGLGHGISPTDGQLDLVVLDANTVGEGVRAIRDLLTQRGGVYGKEVFAGHLRGSEIAVKVSSGSEQAVQLDGDPGGETPFTARVVPGAIQIMR